MDKDTIAGFIEQFRVFKQREWKEKTAKNNTYYFRLLSEFLETRAFSRETILLFFNSLQTREPELAESTRRQAETAIIAFAKWLYAEGITDKDFSSGIKRTTVHRQPFVLPSQEEVLELIRQVTEIGKYDNCLQRFSKTEHRAALSFIVVACGGRNFETSRILRKDVSISGLQLTLRDGKNGARNQAIPNIPWLIEDLKRRVNGLRNKEELSVLKDRSHFKQTDIDRLFVVNGTKMRKTMQKVSKLWGSRVTVHDLRRIFARDLKANGADIDDIRDSMGHRDFQTTKGYLIHDTSTQARTHKHFNTEARRYRTAEEKAKEMLNHAAEIGRVLNGGLKGKILRLEIEL